MHKKSLIQIFLLITLVFFTYFVFKLYYNTNDQLIKKDISKVENLDDEKQSLIKDIKYTSNNNNGDFYEILADYGEASNEDPELMFLSNVKANIIFKDKNKENVKLTSDYANFNTRTFETTFMNKVKITRKDEIITGNELYLVLDKDPANETKEENLLRMSKNVFYKKPGYTLKADILEIDLISKNSKIYMNEDNKKVIATTILN